MDADRKGHFIGGPAEKGPSEAIRIGDWSGDLAEPDASDGDSDRDANGTC